MTIGLIGEGLTDQITIENILIGFLEDKNLSANRLQPKDQESGNWDKVFKYCKTEEFKQSFAFNDIIIIQVDVDFFRGDSVPAEIRFDINSMTVSEIIEKVKALLIGQIDTDFYTSFSNKIIFAIAVDQIECWFLPIYFTDNKAHKTANCTATLNTALQPKEGFTIHAKEEDYYKLITKNFHKKKDLLKYSKANPSFDVFIQELETKIPAVVKEPLSEHYVEPDIQPDVKTDQNTSE